MLENLKKWIYVNDVKNEKLLLVGKIIEETNLEPVIFTRKGEILYYFWKLINGKISLEQFFMFNDTFFSAKIYNFKVKNGFDALGYVKIAWKENKIYILDDLFETDLGKDNVYFV